MNKCNCKLKYNKEDFSADLQVVLVDLIDDLQVARQEILEQVDRPTLQSLWKDGVVSVGASTHGNVPCLQDEREKKWIENTCRIGSC